MPDFGPHSSYILAAYAIAAVTLFGMIASAWLRRSAARKRLARLEADAQRT